jgi:hypothetical protein
MTSLGFSLKEGKYLISLSSQRRGETTLKAALSPNFIQIQKGTNSEKLALLNFLVEAGQSSSLLYQNCSS